MSTIAVVRFTVIATLVVGSAIADTFSHQKLTCEKSIGALNQVMAFDRSAIASGGWVCGTPRVRAEDRVEHYCGVILQKSLLRMSGS
jgi:hypothetical protein